MDETAFQAARSPSDFQTRIDQLDDTLQELQRVRQRLEETEQRFRRITSQCGGLLDALVRLDQQHAASVAAVNTRLSGLADESAQRMESFERGVSHEWDVLRELYEKPIEELRRQARELGAVSTEIARSLGPASDPAKAYELLAANTRSTLAPPADAAAGPWSLDEVARLHQRVRESPNGVDDQHPPPRDARVDRAPGFVDAGAPPSSTGLLRMSGPQLSLPEPGAAERRAVSDRRAGKPAQSARLLWALPVMLLLVAVGLGTYAFQLWERLGRLDARTIEADERLRAAETQVDAVQRSADQRVDNLQQSAIRAQRVAEILAAPDLQRVELAGLPRSGGAYAQVLWSRSRGLVASASRLPAPTPGQAYQLWVLTNNQPVSAGLLHLDGSGRGSLLIGEPLSFPRRMGVVITLEPAGGSTLPGSLVYLRERQ